MVGAPAARGGQEGTGTMLSLSRVAAAAMLAAASGCVAAEGAAGDAGGGPRSRPLGKVELVGALYGDGTDWRDVTDRAVAAAALREDGVIALPVDPAIILGQAFAAPAGRADRALVVTLAFRDANLRAIAGEGAELELSVEWLLAAYAASAARRPATGDEAPFVIRNSRVEAQVCGVVEEAVLIEGERKGIPIRL